jgi:hypothetical protein
VSPSPHLRTETDSVRKKRSAFKFLEHRALGKVQKSSESETLLCMKQEKSKFDQDPPLCTYEILTLFGVSEIEPSAGYFTNKTTHKFDLYCNLCLCWLYSSGSGTGSTEPREYN